MVNLNQSPQQPVNHRLSIASAILRTLAVILALKVVLMWLFNIAGLDPTQPFAILLDSVLLALCSAALLYFWVFRPLFNERSEIQQKLSSSTDKLDEVQAIALMGHWELDISAQQADWSKQIHQLFGTSSTQICGPALLEEFVHPEDWPVLAASLDAAMHDGKKHEIEYRINLADGQQRWIYCKAKSIDHSVADPTKLYGIVQDITARKTSELALTESQSRLTEVTQLLPGAIYISLPPDFKTIYISSGIQHMLGYSSADFIQQDFGQLIIEQDRERISKMLNTLIDSELNDFFIEYRMPHKVSGKIIWIGAQAHIQRDTNGKALKLYGYMMDMTEKKQTEEKLFLASRVFMHSHDGIIITDSTQKIIEVNQAFTSITGYSLEEVKGKNPRFLQSGRHGPEFYKELWHKLMTQGYWSGEVWNKRKNGSLYTETLTISAIKEEKDDDAKYFVGIFSDISDIKKFQQQLEHITQFDALTHLPNRALLEDRLSQAMYQSHRRGMPMAVVYLDLDNFNVVNDHYGHDVGDQLLVKVAEHLKLVLREGDTLARLGGDDFVAVLMDVDSASADSSPTMLERLLEAARQPVLVNELTLQLSASLGVTFFPQSDVVNAETLIRQADQAMYKAKLKGKNNYHIFDTEKDRDIRGRHLHLERVAQGLAEEEFVLFYQPKVNMRSGETVGMEALIRWQHPERGLLAPFHFLPEIEHHALSITVGEWVIATALNQIKAWQAAGEEVPVSVNIGAEQLLQSDFVVRLKKSLALHADVTIRLLTLEILETSALEDVEHVSRVMRECQELGIYFSLDDFGTGYSSLTYLKRLPATEIKIDQSFVRDMLNDPNDLAILEGVLGLARSFNRKTIAEGVETIAHGEMLLQLGCNIGQGYAIARPMPAEKVIKWKLSWQPDPLWKASKAVHHNDLPLLFASTEHRYWITMFDEYLKDERKKVPQLNHQFCHFGQWLNGVATQRYQHHLAMHEVDTLHKQIHQMAAEIVQLKEAGKTDELILRQQDLYSTRDALLGQLRLLLN